MEYLFVNRHFGGEQVPTGRMLNDLVSELLEKGHEVTILTTNTSYAPKDIEQSGDNRAARVIVPFTFGDRFRLLIWLSFAAQAFFLIPFFSIIWQLFTFIYMIFNKHFNTFGHNIVLNTL